MSRYLDFWDFILRLFGREAWRNPNYLFGVQIVRRPKTPTMSRLIERKEI